MMMMLQLCRTGSGNNEYKVSNLVWAVAVVGANTPIT